MVGSDTMMRLEAAAAVTSVTAAPWKLSHLPPAVLILPGFGPAECCAIFKHRYTALS